jgi:hypothetical protein
VLERIARPIDAGSLAVPKRENAVVAGARKELRLLQAPDGSRREILVQPGLKTNVRGF